MKRKSDPAETPEGEALPTPAPGGASPAPTEGRARVTYQTGCGGSVVIDPPETAETDSTEEPSDAR